MIPKNQKNITSQFRPPQCTYLKNSLTFSLNRSASLSPARSFHTLLRSSEACMRDCSVMGSVSCCLMEPAISSRPSMAAKTTSLVLNCQCSGLVPALCSQYWLLAVYSWSWSKSRTLSQNATNNSPVTTSTQISRAHKSRMCWPLGLKSVSQTFTLHYVTSVMFHSIRTWNVQEVLSTNL